MVKRSAGAHHNVSISTMGKPTEKTGVPQPSTGVKKGVMDGIIHGVPRGIQTAHPDGLVRTACHHRVSDGIHAIKPAATKVATQQFGSVQYADAKLGK